MKTRLDPALAVRPHRRWNPLTDEWVLVSPERTRRPWRGAVEAAPAAPLPDYDPLCPLCPGNARAHGERNPAYSSTFVFQNDFPALLPEIVSIDPPAHTLLTAEAEAGECRVICYSPRHDLSLAQLTVGGLREVIDTWAEQTRQLEAHWSCVQVFENRGELMGASNPHPHGQIWATHSVPTILGRELAEQRRWYTASELPLLQQYAQLEVSNGERVVIESAHWLALVPWWAVWPFEILLLPRRSVQRLSQLDPNERRDLATVLRELLQRYDRLFGTPFPYSFGWHGAPSRDHDSEACQLHGHFYPPLLRSATVRKFMVGYELLAEAQRDLTPEEAAQRLRECGNPHD